MQLCKRVLCLLIAIKYMNTLNQILSVTSISIFLGLSVISGVSTKANPEPQLGLTPVLQMPQLKTNQPFIAPNRGTPQTTAGGGIRGFYLQSKW